MTTSFTQAALERMTAREILEVIRLQYAILDAKKAGLDGWEMSLRDALAGKFAEKRAELAVSSPTPTQDTQTGPNGRIGQENGLGGAFQP